MQSNINHSGRRFLIAGGTGDVGEGIVRAFLRTGAVVAVPSRSPRNLKRLRQAIAHDPQFDATVEGRLLTFEGRLDTEEEAALCATRCWSNWDSSMALLPR